MESKISITCTFTKCELFTVIYKNMDWFFRFENSYRENEYFGSLTEILDVIEKEQPELVKIYKLKVAGEWWAKELHFFCTDIQQWKTISSAREHYGLKRKYIPAVGGDIPKTPRA